MTEPTTVYQAEQPSDAPSETPVADFVKRNPYAHSIDLFLFALGQIPLTNGSHGDLNTAPNTAMIEAIRHLLV